LKKNIGHALTEIGFRSILNHVVTTNYKLEFFKALKSSFLLIFLATLVYRIFDQFLTKQIELIIRSSEGISSVIWFWAAISLTLSIIFPIVVAIISLYALKNNSIRNIASFFAQKLELSVLENMRALGLAILWGFLFIIPGLIKMSYYYLTTFVVLFLPEYEEGKVDALKKSEEISKHHWVTVNMLVTVFYFLIPIVTSTIFDEFTVFEKHPLSAAAYCGLEAIFTLWFHYLVLNLFLVYFITPEKTEGVPDVTYV
jgi:hypothetical protein